MQVKSSEVVLQPRSPASFDEVMAEIPVEGGILQATSWVEAEMEDLLKEAPVTGGVTVVSSMDSTEPPPLRPAVAMMSGRKTHIPRHVKPQEAASTGF